MVTYTLKELFPNLKWKDDPIPVEITIRPLVEEEATGSDAVWVARDFNKKLYSFTKKPRRHFHGRFWTQSDKKDNMFQTKEEDAYFEKLDDNLFPILRWEDEPIKAKV